MKRFWKSVTVEKAGPDGWTIHLDGRPVRTPAKAVCAVPVRTMAERIAEEWSAQDKEINPLAMPMTRAAATCLDRVAPEMVAVQDDIASYGETDLLCYRARHPEALIERQAAAWDPVLAWAAEALGAPLRITSGVMHVAQADVSVANLGAAVRRAGPWELTCLAEMTTISGSLVLALAVQHGHVTPPEAWRLSRIDEMWNIEEWGADEEAAAQSAKREADFLHAAKVLDLLRTH